MAVSRFNVSFDQNEQDATLAGDKQWHLDIRAIFGIAGLEPFVVSNSGGQSGLDFN